MFEEHRARVGRWVVFKDLGTRARPLGGHPALLFTRERSHRITVVCPSNKPQSTETRTDINKHTPEGPPPTVSDQITSWWGRTEAAHP